MDTFYRIHPADEAPESILGESRWESRVWVGEAYKRCTACNGEGIHWVSADDFSDDMTTEPCAACDGEGQVEDVRRGVSCCRSIDDLRSYFADRGADLTGDQLITLDGELSDDDDYDADDGAVLVLPSRIVSVVAAPTDWTN
jgi:hypothetical protein